MCLGECCVSFTPSFGGQEVPRKKSEGGLEGVGTHLPYFFSILWGKLIRYTTFRYPTGLAGPYPCRIPGLYCTRALLYCTTYSENGPILPIPIIWCISCIHLSPYSSTVGPCNSTSLSLFKSVQHEKFKLQVYFPHMILNKWGG